MLHIYRLTGSVGKALLWESSVCWDTNIMLRPFWPSIHGLGFLFKNQHGNLGNTQYRRNDPSKGEGTPPSPNTISEDIVRKQLEDVSLKVHITIQPEFVSRKIERKLNVKETKPPFVNQ